MVLAFGFETARAIVQADGRTASSEIERVDRRFSRSRLKERGLLDEEGRPTASFGAAYNLALSRLKTLLNDDEKLELAEAFFAICQADSAVDPLEVRVIADAMRVLGVSREQLARYMRDKIARS
jgi:uncharacterized tellurite resistance protein B-like protein